MLEPLHNTKNEQASSLSNSVHITGCSPIWFVNSIYLAVLFCSFELICQSLQLIQPRCSQCRTFPSGTSALTALLAGQTAPRWAKILAPVEKNPQIPLAFVHVIVSIIANIVGGIVSAGVRGIDRRRSSCRLALLPALLETTAQGKRQISKFPSPERETSRLQSND